MKMTAVAVVISACARFTTPITFIGIYFNAAILLRTELLTVPLVANVVEQFAILLS